MDSLVKSFVRNSILPISLYDRDMRLLVMSKPWKAMYQIADDKIGKSHYQTFQQQPEHWIESHQAALNGNTLEHTEEPYKLPNGASGWHRWQCLPWYGDDGDIKGIIISAEDITSKKDREIELNTVLARFELIQQAAKIGMWDWDIVRRNITFNAEYYEVLGWEKYRNLSNEEFYDLIHPDDLDRVKSALNTALSGGTDYEAEFRIYRHNDGKLRWVKDKGTIEFDADGAPVRGYGAIIDITEQKLINNQHLEYIRCESHKFVDSILDGIWSVDRNGVTVYVNHSMATMLGYDESEMIGRSIYNFLDSEWRNIANSKLEQRVKGKTDRYVSSVKHKNGSDIRFVIGAQPIIENSEFIGTIAIFSKYEEISKLFFEGSD
jgi:PAS domain S-box-containing protein